MSRFVSTIRSNDSPPFATGLASQAGLTLALLLFLVVWMLTIGRPLISPSGTIALWVGDVHSPEASQQFADWYSLLHVVFGSGLWLFLNWMKPQWSVGQKFVIAIASSVAWEAIENLPPIIAAFANAPGAPPYGGDSVFNALADTLFVAFGFTTARFMSVPLVVLTALSLEVVVIAMAGDGYVLGSLRLIGAPV